MLEKVRELNKDKNVALLILCFKDLVSDKVSSEEFEGMCIKWAYHYALRDLRHRALPYMPENVGAFYALPSGKRAKVMTEDSKARTAVLEFRAEELKVRSVNRSNKDWLRKMGKYFESKGDLEKVVKIKEVESSAGCEG